MAYVGPLCDRDTAKSLPSLRPRRRRRLRSCEKLRIQNENPIRGRVGKYLQYFSRKGEEGKRDD